MNTNSMINFYKTHAYTSNYIFGYTANGRVYACFCINAHNYIDQLMTIDQASRDSGIALKYKQNEAKRHIINSNATRVDDIGSVSDLEQEFKTTKYNRGEIFERWLYATYTTQEWHKDNVDFDKGADIVIDGISYQAKFNKATFINEKTYLRKAG